MTPMLMTATQAREKHLEQLNAQVAAEGRCARPAADAPRVGDWFRGDGEDYGEWVLRRGELLQYCSQCPVLTQCREAALRTDANRNADDYVRGGLSGSQLYEMRRNDPTVQDAIDRDDEAAAQEREIHQTHQELHRAALSCGGQGAVLRRNNTVVRGLAQHAASLRTTRRQQTGWGSAA